jgi:hypothetical protein
VVDRDGSIIVPLTYQSLAWINPFSLAGKIAGKYGAIDITGLILVPFQYDRFSEWEENFYEFSSADTVVWMDSENNKIISPPGHSR